MKININGLETHYQLIGDSNQILVMLHGWGCDWQIFAPIISTLSQKFQLLIPDLPGFGQSTSPDEIWSSKDYVNWLEIFLDKIISSKKLGRGPARAMTISLLGHSFGGKIAALFAAAHTDKLQRLILVDSAGLPDTLSKTQLAKQRLIALIPDQVKNSIPTSIKNKILKQINLATDHLQSTPAQRQILKKVIGENIADDLSSIKTPTLIIWGEDDPDTPLHQGKKFHQLISQSQFTTLTNSGHFCFIDQTDQFIQLIMVK